MQEAYIISGFRSAVTKANKGGFRNYRSDDLAVFIIKELMARTPELDPKLVDDVIVGCANPEGEQGLQIGRQISLRALGIEVPGMTVNRYCASGLETISIAVATAVFILFYFLNFNKAKVYTKIEFSKKNEN